MYLTDGQPHKQGVKNEILVKDFLNNLKRSSKSFDKVKKIIFLLTNKRIEDYLFVKKGGTTTVVDLYEKINNFSISIKRKKVKINKSGRLKYEGTFDLLNTSKILNLVDSNNKGFIDIYNKYEKYKKEVRGDGDFEKKISKNYQEWVRERIRKFSNNLLNQLNYESFKNIFNEIILKYEDIDFTIVKLEYIDRSMEDMDLKDLRFIKKIWLKKEIDKINFMQNIKTKNSSWRMINKDGTKSVFRLRIALNNGVKALTGININNDKNKDSQLTFKIQVDGVSQIIENYSI